VSDSSSSPREIGAGGRVRAMFGFGRKRREAGGIVVSDASMRPDADPGGVVADVVGFVNLAVDKGLFEGDAAPEEAALIHAVSGYVGEVCNGGHAQWRFNTAGARPRRDEAVRKGLALFGATALAETHRAYRRLAAATALMHEDDPQSFDSAAFEAIDDAFFAAKDEAWRAFCEHAVALLRARGLLEGAGPDGVAAVVDARALRHPERAARVAARQDRALAGMLSDPMQLAFRTLLFHAKLEAGPTRLLGIGAGRFIALGGIAWPLDTTAGPLIGISGETHVLLVREGDRPGERVTKLGTVTREWLDRRLALTAAVPVVAAAKACLARIDLEARIAEIVLAWAREDAPRPLVYRVFDARGRSWSLVVGDAGAAFADVETNVRIGAPVWFEDLPAGGPAGRA
jgi:hypothetical protein